MECKQFCPLSLSLLFVPLFRSTGSDLLQSVDAQLPVWLWLIFVCLALIAIFWWQFYLRPHQANDVHELEHHFAEDHGSHTHAGEHDSRSSIIAEKPFQEKIGPSGGGSSQARMEDSAYTAETSETDPDNPTD